MDNYAMSAQEFLIEEIKHQSEPVLRNLESWADVLPSREVEQEKLDILDGKKNA
jgi:hypothetical protein